MDSYIRKDISIERLKTAVLHIKISLSFTMFKLMQYKQAKTVMPYVFTHNIPYDTLHYFGCKKSLY